MKKKVHNVIAAKSNPIRLAVGNNSGRVTLRCSEKSASGQPCKAAPLKGKTKCSFHSGDNAKRLGARGGHRRAIFAPENLEKVGLPENAADMKRLLALTIIEVRSGKLDPKIANSISYLSAAFLTTVEASDFDDRLKAMESKTSQMHSESVQ